MFKMFSERQMRRRMGKSPRQWKKDRKAERRGTRLTAAKQWRRVEQRAIELERAAARWAADEYPRSRRSERSRRVTPFFALQAWEPGL